MAGLQNTVTREFLPYVMGVARNVLTGPGEEVENVDIIMNIPLDHFLGRALVEVRLLDLGRFERGGHVPIVPRPSHDRTGGTDRLPRSQRLSLRSVEHLVHHFAETPVVILVMGLQGRHSTPGGSTFPAVQNLLLAARGLGLSGSVFNFPLSREDVLRALLDIPENNQIYCIIPLGYPSDKHGPLRRKPVRDVVYMERFGQRWDYAEAQPDNGWEDRWLD